MIEHCCFRLRGCESWARDLAGIHQTNATALGGIPVLVGMSDGTHSPRQRKNKLLGRVVGYAEEPLGELLESCLGWAD